MDILRAPMPEKLSEKVLSSLSLEDHVKYLFLYHKYRNLLRTSLDKPPEEQIRIRYCLDWFYQINELMTRYARWLGLLYISKTCPLGDWDKQFTVKAFEFAYHYEIGSSMPDCFSSSYVFLGGREFRCLFCGKVSRSDEAVISKGLPSCGRCKGALVVPVKTLLYARKPNPFLERYRSLGGRVADFVERLEESRFVHVFADRRKGQTEVENVQGRLEDKTTPILVVEV